MSWHDPSLSPIKAGQLDCQAQSTQFLQYDLPFPHSTLQFPKHFHVQFHVLHQGLRTLPGGKQSKGSLSPLYRWANALRELIWLAPNQCQSQEQNPSSLLAPSLYQSSPEKSMCQAGLCNKTRRLVLEGEKLDPTQTKEMWEWKPSLPLAQPFPLPTPGYVTSSTGYSRETEVFLTPWASVHRKDLVSQFQGKNYNYCNQQALLTRLSLKYSSLQVLGQDVDLKSTHLPHRTRKLGEEWEEILDHIPTHTPQRCKQNLKNNDIMLVGNKAMHLTPSGPMATFIVQPPGPHLSHISLGNKLPG